MDRRQSRFNSRLDCTTRIPSGQMDQADPTAAGEGVNAGLKKRYSLLQVIQKFSNGWPPLHSDMFFQPKYLLNGVDLHVKLIRSKEEFCLMSATANAAYQIVLQECALFVRKVRVSPSVMLGHAKALEKGTAKLPRPPRRVQTSLGTSRRNVFAARPRVLGTNTSAHHHRLRGQQSIQRQLHP